MQKACLICWSFLLLMPGFLFAQVSIGDSAIRLATLEVTYRGGLPGEDLGQRFGYLSCMGLQSSIKFANNFYLSGGVQVLFGDVVKENDVLRHIAEQGGLLIGNTGVLTGYRINATGWLVPLSIGKIFPIFPGHNPNSGVYVEIGGQYLRHRLGFQSYDDDVVQITGDYRKGYDRLTAGFGLRQSVGYTFFDPKGYVNFSIGLDLSQSFTRGQRTIQFDTGLPDDTPRLDLLTGLRASWTFPLYQRAPDRSYYY